MKGKGKKFKKLGARIKDLRTKEGYTSYEYFAYEHNISRAQFGRYEQGQDLRFTSLVKIVEAFGMILSEVFEEGLELPKIRFICSFAFLLRRKRKRKASFGNGTTFLVA